MAIALAFGLNAFRYPIGDFGRAGPGLFPLMISSMLLVIGVVTVVQAFLIPKVHLPLYFRNILIVIASLCGFAIVSMYVNMIAGIVFMTFCATSASTPYSWKRSAAISLGLVAIALALQYLLGLNMPLF